MKLALERALSTVETEIEWLDKLNEEKCDIDKVISRLKRDLRIIKRNYVECEKYETSFSYEITDIKNAIDDIASLNTLTKTYKRMIIRLFEQIKRKFVSEYSFDSEYRRYISYKTKEAMEKLVDIKCLSNRKLNIFYPNNTNTSLIPIELKEKYNIYASAIEDNNYLYLKSYVDYRILGDLKNGAFITNNSFDVLFLMPRLQGSESSVKDSEKIDILNVLKYLRKDGVFILNIPYSRCSDDILLLLSKKIKNISFVKHCDHTEKTVFIIGNKVEFKSSEDVAIDYNYLISQIDLDYYTELDTVLDFSKYTVPEIEEEVTFFRGSKISKEEMCDYCSNSGLIDSFFKSSKEEESIDKHPLLPFNIGQVGLVLTSSELNGIVEDDDGIPHLIKGMTVKDTNRSEEHEGSEIRSTEVVANRVQINIMSADGRVIKIS